MTESLKITSDFGDMKVTKGCKELRITPLFGVGCSPFYVTYCNSSISISDVEYKCLEKDINKVIDFINNLYGENFPKYEEIKLKTS